MKDKHYPPRALAAYYRVMTRHNPGDPPLADLPSRVFIQTITK
jgi:hypothetical protein